MSKEFQNSEEPQEEVPPYLPQVQAEDAHVVVLVDLRVGRVLGVVDLGVDPLALVVGVVDLPGFPVALGEDTSRETRGRGRRKAGWVKRRGTAKTTLPRIPPTNHKPHH